MGYKLVRNVLEFSATRGIDRLVLIVLAEHASDRSGKSWPAVALIAREARCSTRTVLRALDALKDAGELVVVKHGAPTKGRMPWRPNLYLLTLPSGDTAVTTIGDLEVTSATASGDNYDRHVVTPLAVEPEVNQKRTPNGPDARRAEKMEAVSRLVGQMAFEIEISAGRRVAYPEGFKRIAAIRRVHWITEAVDKHPGWDAAAIARDLDHRNLTGPKGLSRDGIAS